MMMIKKKNKGRKPYASDFLTALTIDECRARVMELQRSTVPQYPHRSPSTINPMFGIFALARHHQFTGWQRLSPFGNHYRLTVMGKLQATVDGTRITLRLAFGTQFRLGLETGLVRWHKAFIGLGVTLLALALLAGVLHPLAGETALSRPISGKALVATCLIFDLFGAGLLFMVFKVSGLWSRHKVLASTAQSLLTDVHDALYVPSYHPALNDIENALMPIETAPVALHTVTELQEG